MPEDMDLTESAGADTLEASTEFTTEPSDEEMYTIKVDGSEEEVSLSELQNGYQRQADYTRKTQELAAERERLQQAETIAQALESDPEGTLRALGSAFGVSGNMPDAPRESADSGMWEEPDDPMAQRLARIESQLEHQQSLTRQQALDKEVTGLKDRYGDFDENALFSHALKERIPNLEAAYAHMNFGEVAGAAAKLQADKDVTEAKRDASVVAGGKTTASGAVAAKGSDKPPSSIREAFSLAKQAHT